VTEPTLYPPNHQIPRLRYHPGSRPVLEAIAKSIAGSSGSQCDFAPQAMSWVRDNIVHPHLVPERIAPDRGLSEEQLIASKRGWCNEQARVFIALCEIREIPARLCFVYHANLVCGHTASEVCLDGRWCFFDPTFNVCVQLPDGRYAEARELSRTHRSLAHRAYQPALEDYFRLAQPHVESCPGWCRADRPKVDAGGDLLAHLGICEYVINGVSIA
jgi:transglutaminase-like putative cysteine protease